MNNPMDSVETLIQTLKDNPDLVEFSEVIEVIDSAYHYTPSEFTCGDVVSRAGTNEGSCKIFAFARLQTLTEQQTLNLFGAFYRQDVLENPSGEDHANIRNFRRTGWSGVSFTSEPLRARE